MIKNKPALRAAAGFAGLMMWALPVIAQEATPYTEKANDALLEILPFEDRTDFDNATRGFIAPLDNPIVKSEDGRTVFDATAFEFLADEAPATANPSLWRQGQLNNISGLFEVTEGIYQVRGLDLSVMSFIQGESGWIVVVALI